MFAKLVQPPLPRERAGGEASPRFLPPLITVSGTCKDGAQRVHASVWSSHTAHELGRGGASAGMGRPI